jgi:glycerophosphoryl diester phosphodiesterase
MPAGFAFLAGASPVLAFAHRGGARHPALAGLENTRAAFAHAVALGYDYLETDVQVTRDGVLVAFHDTLLQRVTDGVGSIEELDAADLARIRVGGSESIPTLSDLVEGLAHTRFNIDVKSDAAVEPLARLIRDRDLYARVLVGSFSGRRVRRFRRLTGGRVPTAASPGEVAAYVVLPGRVARCLTRARPAALQIPHRRGPLVVASPRVLRHAHAAGLPVHVWTVDDPEEMLLLLDRGVDGLMTDRTDILREVLRDRGLWPG